MIDEEFVCYGLGETIGTEGPVITSDKAYVQQWYSQFHPGAVQEEIEIDYQFSYSEIMQSGDLMHELKSGIIRVSSTVERQTISDINEEISFYQTNQGYTHGYFDFQNLNYERLQDFQSKIYVGSDLTNNGIAGLEFFTDDHRYIVPQLYDDNDSDLVYSFERMGLDTKLLNDSKHTKVVGFVTTKPDDFAEYFTEKIDVDVPNFHPEKSWIHYAVLIVALVCVVQAFIMVAVMLYGKFKRQDKALMKMQREKIIAQYIVEFQKLMYAKQQYKKDKQLKLEDLEGEVSESDSNTNNSDKDFDHLEVNSKNESNQVTGRTVSSKVNRKSIQFIKVIADKQLKAQADKYGNITAEQVAADIDKTMNQLNLRQGGSFVEPSVHDLARALTIVRKKNLRYSAVQIESGHHNRVDSQQHTNPNNDEQFATVRMSNVKLNNNTNYITDQESPEVVRKSPFTSSAKKPNEDVFAQAKVAASQQKSILDKNDYNYNIANKWSKKSNANRQHRFADPNYRAYLAKKQKNQGQKTKTVMLRNQA